jgi:putative acetyltransferase
MATTMIRNERPGDRERIRSVHLTAFDTRAEADLVDALREQADPVVSLVAEEGGDIVGHIMFSPATMATQPVLRIMGLAPVAVLPRCQRRGVGSALIREGLGRCRALGFGAVIVLGHAGFYPRFGFAPASRWDIHSEYDVPDDVFMALELTDGSLAGSSGLVKYHSAFANL